MATVLFDDMASDVIIGATGLSELLAVDALKKSAIDFCRRTQVWRAQLDPITVTPYINRYSLDAPQLQAYVNRITDVVLSIPSAIAGVPPSVTQLEAKTIVYLDQHFADWRMSQLAGGNQPVMPTRFYTQDEPSTILLAGMPLDTAVLSIYGSLIPTRSATGMDAYIADVYFEAIIHGAKSRLLIIPDKPWTETSQAMYHKAEYEKAISGANVDAASGFQSAAPIRVKNHSR